LVKLLNDLAYQTWDKVLLAPARGLAFNEESLTDHNLFELDRNFAPIEIYKFNKGEEGRNGADFEWWVGGQNIGWIGLRFQAKKLNDGTYDQLGHRVGGGTYQHQLLIAGAMRDRVWPLYCFYNGWPGGWPDGVPTNVCPSGCTPWPRRGGCSHVTLRQYGCAVAPAQAVVRRYLGRPVPGRKTLESHLIHSIPWSRLFAAREGGDASDLVRALPNFLRTWTWEGAAKISDPALDKKSGLGPTDGIPADRGLHGNLPVWLQAARNGDVDLTEGYRPRLAAVFEITIPRA
jgi:hypothetical protein